MTIIKTRLSWLAVGVVLLLAPGRALAHCDGLDGPVVKAAQNALESGNVALVLIWVRPSDEPEIRSAFEQTRAVRQLGPQARALADRYFFETLVRIHRAGEGAPYTGLQPAGRDLGPAIPAADNAIDSGAIGPLRILLVRTLEDRLGRMFDEVVAARRYQTADVVAGRQFVQAYVEFIHYVERLYEALVTSAHGHAGEPPLR